MGATIIILSALYKDVYLTPLVSFQQLKKKQRTETMENETFR